MLPINSPKINGLLESHVESVIQYFNKPGTQYTINVINMQINNVYPGETLKSILSATPEKIYQLIKSYPTPYPVEFNIFKTYYGYFSKKENDIFKNNAFDIIKALDIRVCPYCNREFIFNARIRRTAEMDHYHPKERYPIFALSFYNLIPVCHTCNHVKRDNMVKYPINPYSVWFKQNSIVIRYNPKLKSTNYINPDSFSLLFLADNSIAQHAVNNHIDLLLLDELYDDHKDIVCELLQKKQIYNESYIDELIEKYDGKFFKNRSELMRLITGNYVTKEDLLKRPLAKLNMDISNQIGLI